MSRLWTGLENVSRTELTNNLLITGAGCRSLGLHKAMVFKLDFGNRKRLPWAEDYFVSQTYAQSENIVAGKLNASHRAITRLQNAPTGALPFGVPVPSPRSTWRRMDAGKLEIRIGD